MGSVGTIGHFSRTGQRAAQDLAVLLVILGGLKVLAARSGCGDGLVMWHLVIISLEQVGTYQEVEVTHISWHGAL